MDCCYDASLLSAKRGGGGTLTQRRFERFRKHLRSPRRETAAALRRKHVKVHVVSESTGGDFGLATMHALTNCAAMAAFCFENYGEKTQVRQGLAFTSLPLEPTLRVRDPLASCVLVVA